MNQGMWIIALIIAVYTACLNGQLRFESVADTKLVQPADSLVLQTAPTKYPPSTEPPYPPSTDPPYPPSTDPPYPPSTDPPYPPSTTPPYPPSTNTPGYPSSPSPTPYVPPNPYPTDVYPYDPYEPYDPYDPYPFYFCELNEDEYGRPYYGPYDEYRPPYRPTPTYPPPTSYPPVYTVPPTPYVPPTTYVPPIYVRPLTTTALPPRETYDLDLERLAKRKRRQVLTLPSCVTSNECNQQPETCYGSGTQYDRCGRRCTCRNGRLQDCCRVRKEWRSMTQVERCRYVQVVLAASTQQPWKRCYDELIRVHRDEFGTGIHGITFFLPWHRWFILALENLLRQIDCHVTVPYWDWSLEPQTWQNSIMWATQCGFGGDGVPANGNEVGTGPFRAGAWQLTPSANNNNGGNLRRNFNGILPDCASVATIQRSGMAEFNSWHTFVSSNLHDTVHCNIGGTMCTVDSANAPEFFLHHGFIDKIWLDWQNKGPAFKHLPFYASNTNAMPGAFGYTPQNTYDLDNQPGCVRVCVEPSSRPCRVNTTYTPACPKDMGCYEYSPIKLAGMIPRPYPRVPEEAFELFNTPYEIRRVSNRYTQLFNDYDQLYNVLQSNGYDGSSTYRPPYGEVQFDRYLYQPGETYDPYLPPPPDECRPYFPPTNY